ncbi:hypothetical protein BFP70_16330 [Thioclava sp. SK-1]|uniref:hypothetical protein n=1 Tax=Thioclava sp. SK-1 TaxID=1889770 RepID=UPI000826961D|nr:hypothetical protein [Thioclava sp. SK-1]OCX61021.1 hypothetical protein BFP70_16330 [Thioclava sp. SK-1]
MQVVYHLGAHNTDEDRLIRALARNPNELAEHGVVVPHPRRYRLVLRDTLMALKGASADPGQTEAVLAAVTDRDDIGRIVFSHEFFLCVPERVITEQGFYVMVPSKLQPLANIFPDAEIEFHIALINPATLIPGLVARDKNRDYDEIMHGHDPRDMRWGPVIAAMKEAAPNARLVVWCNEDLPLIWPEVMRSLSALPEDQPLKGEQVVLRQIMTEGGFDRLAEYLTANPPKSILQRRKIVSAFLAKFARPEELEVEAALPGWTEELVDSLSALYDADVEDIAAMDGVEFITP